MYRHTINTKALSAGKVTLIHTNSPHTVGRGPYDFVNGRTEQGFHDQSIPYA